MNEIQTNAPAGKAGAFVCSDPGFRGAGRAQSSSVNS